MPRGAQSETDTRPLRLDPTSEIWTTRDDYRRREAFKSLSTNEPLDLRSTERTTRSTNLAS